MAVEYFKIRRRIENEPNPEPLTPDEEKLLSLFNGCPLCKSERMRDMYQRGTGDNAQYAMYCYDCGQYDRIL